MGVYFWVEYPYPWTNTLAYRPLNSTTTVNDQSGNNIQSTNVWVTFWTYQWVDCWYFDWNSYIYTNSGLTTIPATWTSCVWFYYDGNSTTSAPIYWQTATDNASIKQTFRVKSNWVNVGYWVSSTSSWGMTISQSPSWWCMMCRAWDWSSLNFYLYKNWTKYTATKDSSYTSKDETFTNFSIWYEAYSKGWYIKYKWWVSNLIIENRMRTEQEIADYYNNTKSIYGL